MCSYLGNQFRGIGNCNCICSADTPITFLVGKDSYNMKAQASVVCIYKTGKKIWRAQKKTRQFLGENDSRIQISFEMTVRFGIGRKLVSEV